MGNRDVASCGKSVLGIGSEVVVTYQWLEGRSHGVGLLLGEVLNALQRDRETVILPDKPSFMRTHERNRCPWAGYTATT